MSFLLVLLFLGTALGDTMNMFTQYSNGDATYYGESSGGHCSLDTPSLPPAGLTTNGIWQTVALNTAQYGTSEPCGMCVMLYPNGTGSGGNPLPGIRKVFVADECPTCNNGDLDIASVGDGRWQMHWIAVPCGIESNVQYLLQGSNPYYIKLQVRNHNYPILSVKALGGSTFYEFTRTSDNFFTAPGGFPFPWSAPLELQITSVAGQVYNDTLTGAASGIVYEGGFQFGQASSTSTTHHQSSGGRQYASVLLILAVLFAVMYL